MKRREFIALLGSAAIAWPVAAAAQQPSVKKLPRIGYLMDRVSPGEFDEAFLQGLHELGYVEGRTIAKYGAQVGAKDLVPLGVILSGDLAPAKARILLMVLLAVSQDNDELTRLFADASP